MAGGHGVRFRARGVAKGLVGATYGELPHPGRCRAHPSPGHSLRSLSEGCRVRRFISLPVLLTVNDLTPGAARPPLSRALALLVERGV